MLSTGAQDQIAYQDKNTKSRGFILVSNKFTHRACNTVTSVLMDEKMSSFGKQTEILISQNRYFLNAIQT